MFVNRNLFPTNLIQAAFQQDQTVRTLEIINSTMNLTKVNINQTVVSGMNALGKNEFNN